MISNHLILCRPLLLLPSLFLSIRVFSNELALWNRWQKYWSCSFNIIPSNEYSGLISFRIDWFELLAVQGTSSPAWQLKASTLQCSAFFMAQLSHPYMTTGRTITLTTWAFSVKWCLCFLICFVIAFFPRSKHVLISWQSAVILEPKKIKSVIFHFFPHLPWSDGILYEYWHQIPQQNTSKLNPASCKKNYTPWPSDFYPWNTWLI